LKKLTYTDWVQFETTRLFDVANGLFLRIALEDHFIKDVPITKGTIVTAQPTGNHYNEKYFKEPFEFRPERWES
jgi:cytochrome P450